MPFAGVSALAVDGDRVLLVGGYSAPDRVILATFARSPTADPTADGRVEPIAEFVLRAPDGTPLRGAPVIGRAGTLHVFNGPDWYGVDVTDL